MLFSLSFNQFNVSLLTSDLCCLYSDCIYVSAFGLNFYKRNPQPLQNAKENSMIREKKSQPSPFTFILSVFKILQKNAHI